jgi:excisionase family DNA binding protein
MAAYSRLTTEPSAHNEGGSDPVVVHRVGALEPCPKEATVPVPHPASTAPDVSDWITPGAAATMLGISPKRVSDLVDSGELDGYRPGGGGHRRVSLAAVNRRLGGTS